MSYVIVNSMWLIRLSLFPNANSFITERNHPVDVAWVGNSLSEVRLAAIRIIQTMREVVLDAKDVITKIISNSHIYIKSDWRRR